MGARVIKIERTEGDFARGYDAAAHGDSSYFLWTNHGKESVVLDLKSKKDINLMKQLLKKADVFVQNLAPGVMKRLGFGSEDMRKKNSRLITCDISGYGETGPARDLKAYDFLVQAEDGIRDVERSRGLGDVYKRQHVMSLEFFFRMSSDPKPSLFITPGARF